MAFAARRGTKFTAVMLALTTIPAFAESPAQVPQDPADSEAASITLPEIEVISEQLEAARLQIQPSLGASTYYFGSEALQTISQGEVLIFVPVQFAAIEYVRFWRDSDPPGCT
jgi:hypothetical protein